MNLIKFLVLLLVSFSFISACSTDEVLRVRQLSKPVDISSSRVSGDFDGLDKKLDDSISGNVNVLYVHGIGWNQNSADDFFGFDLIKSIHDHYGLVFNERYYGSYCVNDKVEGNRTKYLKIISGSGSVFGVDSNTGGDERFYGDKNFLEISSKDLGCLDRSTINVGEGKTITVYRYFWDNAFYDNIGWEHFGYDDAFYEAGYEKIAKARYRLSGEIKDQVVTYGFGDALLYTGEAGQLMRKGLMGAICASVTDGDRLFDSSNPIISVGSLCEISTKPYDSPFLLITHSLGSRLAFDLLTTDLTEGFAAFLSKSNNQTEWSVIMLANQIPLFSLGRLSQTRKSNVRFTENLKFIAFSEINDLFIYELVPYFEHLLFSRCGILRKKSILNIGRCDGIINDSNLGEAVRFVQQSDTRKQLSDELGFDVIDVRVAFAGKLGFVLPVADPNVAHKNYILHKSVSQPIFCGINEGEVASCEAHGMR